MASEYTPVWTDEAIRNLEDIIDYLQTEWSEREVNQFKNNLSRQIKIIQKYPAIFPKSTIQPRLRKAVISRQTSVFYEIKDKQIYLGYLFDNRQNPTKLQ